MDSVSWGKTSHLLPVLSLCSHPRTLRRMQMYSWPFALTMPRDKAENFVFTVKSFLLQTCVEESTVSCPLPMFCSNKFSIETVVSSWFYPSMWLITTSFKELIIQAAEGKYHSYECFHIRAAIILKKQSLLKWKESVRNGASQCCTFNHGPLCGVRAIPTYWMYVGIQYTTILY